MSIDDSEDTFEAILWMAKTFTAIVAILYAWHFCNQFLENQRRQAIAIEQVDDALRDISKYGVPGK